MSTPPPGHQAPVGSRGGRRRRRRGDPNAVVPDVEFASYYGRPVVKASPWTADIPSYLFTGGLAGGCALLAEGAARSGRPALRRNGRLGALAGIGASFFFLVNDLGRPGRLLNMLRVAKPTSPMSVGTWLLTVFGPAAGVAGIAELPVVTGRLPRWAASLLRVSAGPAGVVAAVTAPAVATYTAVLLADTATPAWNSARRELPFVFAGSAAAASGGLLMALTPGGEAGPARRVALAGVAAELVAEQAMNSSMGMSARLLHEGTGGRWHRAARVATLTGAALTVLAGRSRAAAVVGGAALATGSLATRFAVFEAGQASANDPAFTVVPQRERLAARGATRGA